MPVGPGPVDPGPGPIPPVHSEGITLAQYDAIQMGWSEADVAPVTGSPFRTTQVSGMTVWVYALADSDSVAWVFFKDGKVVRKSRL